MPSLLLDTSVYSMTAIQKCAYLFTSRAFVVIQLKSEKLVEVQIRAKSGQDNDTLVGEFLNEALDQNLRELIARETEGVRDLIITHALSKTSLLN